MKTTFALVLCVALAGICAADKYTTKYDNVDIDQILSNERLLKPYINCLLKEVNCTPDGRELKRVLPDALTTNCSKCSEKQRVGAEKVITHLSKNKPETWNEILAKYDKDNIYRTKYADEARKRGITV